jgi:hypothetical protein
MKYSKKRCRKFRKKTRQKQKHSQKRTRKIRYKQKGGDLIKDISRIIVGKTYDIKFMDDESSDRIEREFAPKYNGIYTAIEKLVLKYDDEHDEDYNYRFKYDDVPYVIFERKTDQRIIHIIEDYGSKTKDGDRLYFNTPVDSIRRSFEPKLFRTFDNPHTVGDHDLHAYCNIYSTLQDELLNVSRVTRLKKEGETVANNIPSDIEKNIQKFFVKNTKIDNKNIDKA